MCPSKFIPEWLYSYLFFPPLQTSSGHPWTASHGLRKTEAQLLKEGLLDTDSRLRKLCLLKPQEKGYTRSVLSRFTKRIGQET